MAHRQYSFVLLNPYNYADWSETTQIYLEHFNLWDVVEHDCCVEPSPYYDFGKYNAWKEKNDEALLVIRSSCGPKTIHLIRGKKMAKEAWWTLEAKFSKVDIRIDSHTGNPSTKSYDYGRVYDEFIGHMSRRRLYEAIESCKPYPDLLKERVTNSRNTPYFFELIMMAGRYGEGKKVVKMLETARFPTEELLELKNSTGDTPLTVAANVGANDIAQYIISKKPSLLSVPNVFGLIPVTVAVGTHFHNMIDLLYDETHRHHQSNVCSDEGRLDGVYGATLVTKSIQVGKLDIALKMLQYYPELTLHEDFDGKSPLYAAAGAPSLFRKERPRFWHGICDRIRQWGSKASSFILCPLKIKSIKWQKSLKSSVPSELLDLMEHAITSSNSPVYDALFEAIKWGNINLVVMLMKANRQISKEVDDMSRNIYMCAIEHRQPEIFNLIFLANDDEEVKPYANLGQDKWKNNLLHMAATLAPAAALNFISGPALQMQRELQWFKEVEKLVPPSALRSRNRDHMTPGELFNMSHKDLVVAGEKWMKETAYSCTIIGPLIITIMFAAAFQVPGGNDQTEGYPIFLDKILFKVYIVSVAMSLFSATTSVLMFLKLLTSKYTEEEFLKSLPNKMIIGLSTLFLSLATMIIAFCTGLFLSLHGELTILIPVIVLAFIPVYFFGSTQFPLLVEICRSTYRPITFNRKTGHVSTWKTYVKCKTCFRTGD